LKIKALPRAAVAFFACAVGGASLRCRLQRLQPGAAGRNLTQGYVIDPQAIDSVPIGSSREQVLWRLASPSTTATFDNEVFYYISQTRKRAPPS
jgi:outer membrane protein assembly factor BamE (lipoprotein component of BamABCDE complex)